MRARLKDWRFWLAAFAIGVVLAARFSGLGSYVSLETLAAHRQDLTLFAQSHFPQAALAYVGIYITVVALSLPGALFLSLTGGFLFGALTGALLTVTSATCGATIMFLVARTLSGDRALERLGTRGVLFSQNIRRNAWAYLLALRLIPLFPFFLVNLAPAFAGVGLATFVFTTFFGIIPGTAIFSLSGAGLGAVLEQGGAISAKSILTPEILAALSGLALFALLSIPLRRHFGGAEPDA
jgi:uncharacterized membrane protein YdjX (TVP38/TMEM64 family)